LRLARKKAEIRLISLQIVIPWLDHGVHAITPQKEKALP
jgi:hypothetical protein